MGIEEEDGDREHLDSMHLQELGDEREIGVLPAHTFVRDGERELQACGERYLTETEIQRLLTAGLIPVASQRDRNTVVVIRFQSASDPPAPMA